MRVIIYFYCTTPVLSLGWIKKQKKINLPEHNLK